MLGIDEDGPKVFCGLPITPLKAHFTKNVKVGVVFFLHEIVACNWPIMVIR